MLKYPSFRKPLDIAFCAACLVLLLFVIVPELWGAGKSKDYPLWYWAGQQKVHGNPLYESTGTPLSFIYPPVAAVLMALPSMAGKLPMYVFLGLVNAFAWWLSWQLTVALNLTGREPPQLVAVIVGVVMVPFIFDQFDLGQPNLLLLALMLLGLWLMQNGRDWSAGAMFALAAAIKAFPIAVLPYLLLRRRWAASASLGCWLVILLLVLPAPIRGFQRNLDEVSTWFHAMVGSTSEQGFGQRGEQNWSWKNQSLISLTHRLVRPVNYNMERPDLPAANVNVLDVSYKTANLIVAGLALIIGLGFVALTLPASQITRRSNADELGILFCLMTVASPLARQYYFVWLFFPIAIALQHAFEDARPDVRRWTWVALGGFAALLLLSLPIFPKVFQAAGNNFVATGILAAVLAWHMRHPPAHAAN